MQLALIIIYRGGIDKNHTRPLQHTLKKQQVQTVTSRYFLFLGVVNLFFQ